MRSRRSDRCRTSTCSIASACSSIAELAQIVSDFPGLRVVVEHITTREAAQFVADAGPNVAATITPQHLLYSRNALFAGGLRPHLYCLPILKRETHRAALVAAATSGNRKFFLGTDSAPHARHTKEAPADAPAATRRRSRCRSTAEAFEDAEALDRLEGFASLHGPAFYGLPPNEARVTLERADEPVEVPAAIQTGAGPVVVFDPGRPLHWRVID